MFIAYFIAEYYFSALNGGNYQEQSKNQCKKTM